MEKGIFKTLEARKLYMESLGTFYAGLGGLFCAYRIPREAFENAVPHRLYRKVAITEADYPSFETGFLRFQELRNAMTLEKARAQAVMTEILSETDTFGGIKVIVAKDVKEMIALQQQGKAKQS